jgi:hypothetical protein
MKNCKVIASYGGKRAKYSQEQTDGSIANTIIGLKAELTVDKGVPCDTIVVNNSFNDEAFTNTLMLYHKKKTKNGEILILKGDNIGISFGAYNKAFESYRDIYDGYWMFTEDDWIFTQDNYLKESIDMLSSNSTLCFVCLVGRVGRQGSDQAHCNGGIGVTKKEYIDKVYAELGKLPYWDNTNLEYAITDKGNHIEYGEVLFTSAFQNILKKSLAPMETDIFAWYK